MNLKDKKITKIGKAVAGSALLVGATLAGATAVAAQSGSSGNTLGDYPAPFVGEDGTVDASIVVGQSAKTIDVVGGIELAGTLSQAAFTEETVSTGSGSFGWSASNGVTLDTRNDQIYFGDDTNKVRETLTQDNLEILSETTFTDGNGDNTDITNYLNVGNQSVTFGNGPNGLDNQDPVLHVPVTAENNVDDTTTNHLFELQANMDSNINFTKSDVQGEEIELFGKTYTISESSGDNDQGDNQIVLFGSSEEVSLDVGQSATRTVGGEEHTFELTGVTSSDEAVLQVDGEQEIKAEDETFSVSGQEVRIKDVLNYAPEDSSTDSVTLGIGSDELGLEAGQPVQDSDGEDVEGTFVTVNGQTSSTSSGYQVGDGVSSISIAVGAEDDENDYVGAGESFSHSLFENVVFRFGGLNPSTGEGESDTVGEVQFSTSGDDLATVDWTSEGGDSASVEFVHDSDPTNKANTDLEDNDQDTIHVVEGAEIQQDEYFFTDSGDFSHMWEVTNIDRDNTGANIASGDKATIDIQDVATGNSVAVDLDAAASDGAVNSSDDEYFAGTEIIDGQTYTFVLEGDSDGSDSDGFDSDSNTEFKVAWDSGVPSISTTGTGIDANYGTGNRIATYTPVDTKSGSALALTNANVTVVSGISTTGNTTTLELPSTESSASQTIDLTVEAPSNTTSDFNLTVDGSTQQNDVDNIHTFTQAVGQTDYLFNVTDNDETDDTSQDGTLENANIQIEVSLADSQTSPSTELTQPAALVIQPQDDNDEEHAYVVAPQSDGSEYVEVHDGANGVLQNTYSSSYSPTTLDSDDNMHVDYNYFGTYTEEDSDEQGTFTLNIPDGQATVGAAFTGMGGSLSASSGGGAVTTQTPAGWPDVGMLDSDVTSSTRNNQNLILVGGPAVNTLVQELADEGKTQAASEYTEGQGMIQQIDDAFSQGNDALVVAGMTGQDTRTAANYLANYQDHQSELTGDKVTINTAQGTVVQ